jgi:hypothetical protein
VENERTEIPIKTDLSPLCAYGAKKKKKLSERLHMCQCGVRSQRDVFSAYLGMFYVLVPTEWGRLVATARPQRR